MPQGGAASCVAIYAGCSFNVNQGSLSFFISSSQVRPWDIFYSYYRLLGCDELTAMMAGTASRTSPAVNFF
jgi:hypothetical protein